MNRKSHSMNRHSISVSSIVIGTGSFIAMLIALSPLGADAQEYHKVHDRVQGELSPGTKAPTRQALMNVIESGSTQRIVTTLEYGERVECHACVPILERYLVEHKDSEVRRISAWWLRRRSFGIGAIMRDMKAILKTDTDSTRRARAAMAIGEFLDPNGLAPLRDAAMADTDAIVRAASVVALGRLNHSASNAIVAAKLSDADVSVRRAAIAQVLKLNFFREHAALVQALGDEDVMVRRRAARVIGSFRVEAALPALAGLLRGDADRDVRQAAAWALGRVGGAEARSALGDVRATESDSLVKSAIEVALSMR